MKVTTVNSILHCIQKVFVYQWWMEWKMHGIFIQLRVGGYEGMENIESLDFTGTKQPNNIINPYIATMHAYSLILYGIKAVLLYAHVHTRIFLCYA